MTGLPKRADGVWYALAALALLVGTVLLVDNLLRSSATYDEVAYMRLAAKWWRTGQQDEIARMGSPVTFFKLQQAPVLAMIDTAGFGAILDNPLAHQSVLLPLVRFGATWVWALALVLTAVWTGIEHGPRALAFAAWLFALSPNLIAHGTLVTMELPLVACAAVMGLCWSRFLATRSRGFFFATAALGGLAFSCKFTAVVLPPLFGLAWWLERIREEPRRPIVVTVRLGVAMLGFLLIMAIANVIVTGGARLPISEQTGDHPLLAGKLGPRGAAFVRALIETPIPQDWAAFVRQMQHQRSGGPSYLLGQRRMHGWWYYYFVCLAVKVPISLWVLVIGRCVLARKGMTSGDRLALTTVLGTLVIVALGSSRNYGFRYLLFLAPLSIVWLSALAERGGWAGRVAIVGLVGQALAIASIHPYELSYFPVLIGGPERGKFILADSNLDWGQGAKALARLQRQRPELCDLTTYYFGDTDPGAYGVVGERRVIDAHEKTGATLLGRLTVATGYLAVSRSLQFGPWGPEGYFDSLRDQKPVAITPDHTIAVYRGPFDP